MPKSQSHDVDDSTDASNANKADNKLIRQGNQAPQLRGLNLPEHFIMEQARKDDLLCVLLTIVFIGAAAGTFCYTRNLFSFGFLTLLPLPLSIRRRKEEAIFPISTEDYQIRLKELEIEMEKVRKQNSSLVLPFSIGSSTSLGSSLEALKQITHFIDNFLLLLRQHVPIGISCDSNRAMSQQL